MQNAAFHTQSDQAQPVWAYICTGAGWGVILSCCLPQNNEAGAFCIVNQNQEVQKGLLALESRGKKTAIKSAFSWFVLSSSVITQL